MPYLPLVGAGAALSVDLLKSQSSALADLVLGVGLVSMVLTRQFLAMIDNQRLLTALAEAGGQLEHQAMHDALTGLPNRTLFAKRLDRALFASSSNVDVLFCDLDNFKYVNDELGHGAGDLLLKIVADRLLECVRSGDTVARLGGDEFAILLEDCPDAREVADRIVASMETKAEVLGRRSARRSASVSHATKVVHARPASGPTGSTPPPRPRTVRSPSLGQVDIAESEARAERQATAALLIRLADTAMYAAKSAGKGRAAVLEADPILTPAGN